MRFSTMLAVVYFVCTAFPALAQEYPKPEKEHQLLAEMVGAWDAVMTGTGLPPSKGEAVFKMECGGLWLTSTFDCDMGGFKFQGKGLDSYDVRKKKYVSVWVDSMTTSPMIFEGEVDASKNLVMFADAPDESGKPAKWRSISVSKDKDHHTFKLYKQSQGGQEELMLTIEYTRRK